MAGPPDSSVVLLAGYGTANCECEIEPISGGYLSIQEATKNMNYILTSHNSRLCSRYDPCDIATACRPCSDIDYNSNEKSRQSRIFNVATRCCRHCMSVMKLIIQHPNQRTQQTSLNNFAGSSSSIHYSCVEGSVDRSLCAAPEGLSISCLYKIGESDQRAHKTANIPDHDGKRSLLWAVPSCIRARAE